MKKCTLHGIAIAAIAALVLAAHAQDSIDQSQYPTILTQPVDACVQMGTPATFSVQATNADSYQWYLNNVARDGQTNSSLIISSTGISDVGYYSASVLKGSEAVPTRLACLNVYVTGATTTTPAIGSVGRFSRSLALPAGDLGGGGMITVFGAPIVSNGGTGTCPGKYSGYVNYTKPVSQGWGWSPMTNTTYSASDTNRGDTKIQYAGYYGDMGCALSSVTIPSPALSPVYRFCVYFPQGVVVPTNAYPITLSGFNP